MERALNLRLWGFSLAMTGIFQLESARILQINVRFRLCTLFLFLDRLTRCFQFDPSFVFRIRLSDGF